MSKKRRAAFFAVAQQWMKALDTEIVVYYMTGGVGESSEKAEVEAKSINIITIKERF